jgi:hypothetical protein
VTSVEVNMSGPIFTGQADAAVRAFVDDAEQAVAAQAYADVMTNLNASIKHPTPYYETQITVTKAAGGRVVHDRGIVYGPWLESGAGRRTRFRGYHSFAKARAAVEAKAPGIVQHTLRKWLRQMGG